MKQKNSGQWQGILLDIDGTLVDSNDQHAQAWVDALAEQDIEVTFEAVRHAIGMGGDKLLPTVAHIEKDSPAGKIAGKRRGEIFKQKYLPHVRAFPKTRELLQCMRDKGLRLIIASSGEAEEVQSLLQIIQAEDLIETMSTAQDTQNSKPAPEPIEVALQKARLSPDQVLMLGDTPYDIEAAERAGVKTIALRCGGWSDADLKNSLAVFDDPADLFAQYAASPLTA